MGFVKEFKEFALKGNVMDMAVGVIIGGAFGTIINSMIGDMIMPVVGMAGKADFSNMYLPLSSDVTEAVKAAGKNGLSLVEARKAGPVLAYGSFITVAINFVILALCVFMMIKLMNMLKRQAPPPPAAPPAPTKEQMLLTEIRDAIKARG